MTKLNNILYFLVLSAMFASILTPVQAGGPWLLKKGEGFIQAQAIPLAYRYDRILTGVALKDYDDINRGVYFVDMGLYAEYGITDKLDLLANIPFKYVDVGEQTDSLYFPELLEAGSISGLSNLRFGLKYGILDTGKKAAISFQASLATASFEQEKGLATGYDANAFGLFGHFGGSFAEKWYAFAELGFMKYTDDFSDIIEGKVEVGRTLGSNFLLIMTTDIRQSLENGNYFDQNFVQTGLYPNDQEWITISAKLNYEMQNQIGASFGLPLIPIQFQNVGYAGSFTFGLYKMW